jgi:hypothetical protein
VRLTCQADKPCEAGRVYVAGIVRGSKPLRGIAPDGILVIENITGGAICRVLVSDVGAWGWEGVRYVVEAEDSVKFYCEDLLADVVQSA